MSYRSHQQAMTTKSGAPVYGLDAELEAKKAAKMDRGTEDNVRRWIEEVTGQRVNGDLENALHDGVLLCTLVNKIKPGTIPNVNRSSMPFSQMENINAFLRTCKNWGLPEHDLFMTVDLYEGKNIPQVMQCLISLSSLAQSRLGYRGSGIGVKMADKNERQFTDSQKREAAAAVPKTSLGSHGGATQAGMRDTSREVVKVPQQQQQQQTPTRTAASPTAPRATPARTTSAAASSPSSSGSNSNNSRSAPSGGSGNSGGSLDDLEKLANLKQKGIITEAEFQAKKKQILGL